MSGVRRPGEHDDAPAGRAASTSSDTAATGAAAPKVPGAPKTSSRSSKQSRSNKQLTKLRQTAADAKPSRMVASRPDRILNGMRFSGFAVIILGVGTLAVFVLAPTITGYAQQRQEIAAHRATVSQLENDVQNLKNERERWNDRTFLITQARERLYYVLPGEISYLVIDDRPKEQVEANKTKLSTKVTEGEKGDWMRRMLDSVMTAGLAPVAETPNANTGERQ